MSNFINYIINENFSLNQTLKKLERNKKKYLFVVNKDNRFLGSITDGDIRRSILTGKKLSSLIKDIYNKKAYYVYQNEIDYKKVSSIVNDNLLNIQAVPVLSKPGKKIVNLITRYNLLKNINIFIMAGGKGERLNPFSKILPKPLIPIDEKPVIDHIIESFSKYGMNNFYVSTNYKAEIIKAYLNDTKKNLKINYIKEKKPLGTIGSLKFLEKKIKHPIMVTNCDILTKIDLVKYYEYHEKNKFDLTCLSCKKNFIIPYGNCKLDKNNNFVKIEEKPSMEFLINVGLYIINPKIIKFIKKNVKTDMNDFINKVKKNGGKIGFYIIKNKDWTDIGEWSKYKQSLNFFKK